MLGSGPRADRGRQGCRGPRPPPRPWALGARLSFMASTACVSRTLRGPASCVPMSPGRAGSCRGHCGRAGAGPEPGLLRRTFPHGRVSCPPKVGLHEAHLCPGTRVAVWPFVPAGSTASWSGSSHEALRRRRSRHAAERPPWPARPPRRQEARTRCGPIARMLPFQFRSLFLIVKSRF